MAEEKKTTENTDAVETEKPKFVVSSIETEHEPTERSNDEILRIFNKRRPYCPNDFKKQSFIPNLRHIDEKQR